MVAIVASLIFVGLQLRQDRATALTSLESAAAANSAEIAALLVGNGDLWRRGLDGESLTEGEAAEFYAIANAVDWFLNSEFIRARSFDDGDPDAYIRDYAYAMHVYPGLRRVFEENMDMLRRTDEAFGGSVEPGPFHSAVLRRMDVLDESQPPAPVKRSYVFW